MEGYKKEPNITPILRLEDSNGKDDADDGSSSESAGARVEEEVLDDKLEATDSPDEISEADDQYDGGLAMADGETSSEGDVNVYGDRDEILDNPALGDHHQVPGAEAPENEDWCEQTGQQCSPNNFSSSTTGRLLIFERCWPCASAVFFNSR